MELHQGLKAQGPKNPEAALSPPPCPAEPPSRTFPSPGPFPGCQGDPVLQQHSQGVSPHPKAALVLFGEHRQTTAPHATEVTPNTLIR